MSPPYPAAAPSRVGSSGNILADKRYAYAEALAAEGDFVAAADLFGQAIDQAPRWAAAHLARGLALETMGDAAGAREALAAASALDGDGLLGAALHLDRLRGTVPAGMPAAYVETLFDQYATRFDAHLVDGLGYRGPRVIADALVGLQPDTGFALDLGCGTGLLGRSLARPGLVLDGVDLSAAMLTQAEATGCYRHLWQGDCVAVMDGLPAGDYGLVAAADVLVYIGDLRPLCTAVARVLKAGGFFAATVQTRAGSGYGLGPDLRFRHGDDHLRACLATAGLEPLRLDACVTRQEKGTDVPGLVFVARRS